MTSCLESERGSTILCASFKPEAVSVPFSNKIDPVVSEETTFAAASKSRVRGKRNIASPEKITKATRPPIKLDKT